jgi:hypothetical protein
MSLMRVAQGWLAELPALVVWACNRRLRRQSSWPAMVVSWELCTSAELDWAPG